MEEGHTHPVMEPGGPPGTATPQAPYLLSLSVQRSALVPTSQMAFREAQVRLCDQDICDQDINRTQQGSQKQDQDVS